jgi:hypothetical protein
MRIRSTLGRGTIVLLRLPSNEAPMHTQDLAEAAA